MTKMLVKELKEIESVMLCFVFSYFRQDNVLKCSTDIIKGSTVSRFVKLYFCCNF